MIEEPLIGDAKDKVSEAALENPCPWRRWRALSVDLCMCAMPVTFSFIYSCSGVPSLAAFILAFNATQLLTALLRFAYDLPKFPSKDYSVAVEARGEPPSGQTIVDLAGLAILGIAVWGAVITFPNVGKYFGGADGCDLPIFCCAFITSVIPVAVVIFMLLGWAGKTVLEQLYSPKEEGKDDGGETATEGYVSGKTTRLNPMLVLTLVLCLAIVRADAAPSTPKSVSQAARAAALGVVLPVGTYLYGSLAYTLLRDLPADNALEQDLRSPVFRVPFVREGGEALEIGVGSGLSKNAACFPAGLQLTGVDINAGAAITEATAKRNRYTPVLGSAEEMSMFGEGSFDTVISTFSLCTIAHPDRALREVSRVLRRGGHFIAIEHILAKPHEARDAQKEGLLGSLGFGLREQQQLLSPWQQVAANGCHLDRSTDQLLSSAVQGGMFSKCVYRRYVDFTTKWPINSQVFAVLQR